ncbi:MAG TPA: anti-sigma factor [Acidimicrobiales bacterium]|nr:anti-sigma factor [Acidimicrobiales bacterium]
MTSSHDELRELVAAYSLDALEPAETAEVAEHLAGCAECRAELRELRTIAGQLGTSDTAPPTGLWDRISEELVDDPPTPIASAKRGRSRRWVALAVAAAIVAIVGLGVLVINQQRRLDDAHREIAAQVEGQGAVERAARAAAAAPGSRQVALVSPQGDAVADVVIASTDEAYVIPRSMRPLGSGETYQLWGKHGSQLISLGVLGSRPTATLLSLPSGIEAIAVTVEDAPGVVTSHHTPIAGGSVA